MASTSNKGKARKQEEQHVFLSDLDILQSKQNYRVRVIKATERGNPLKKDFLAYVEPATDATPEKKLPVALYQGVWHTLKYTTSLNEKLVYVSEPILEVHDYDVEVPIRSHQSESDTERDLLDTIIRNSPVNVKDPLAPITPDVQTPFFSIAKSDFSQSITGTSMSTQTQTITQTTAAAVAPQNPFTEAEFEELLNVAMGERGGGTGGTPPGPPAGGGPPGGGPATGGTANQPIAAATNVKAMGKDPPTFHGDRSKANMFMNEVEKYLTLNDDVAGFKSPKRKSFSS